MLEGKSNKSFKFEKSVEENMPPGSKRSSTQENAKLGNTQLAASQEIDIKDAQKQANDERIVSD